MYENVRKIPFRPVDRIGPKFLSCNLANASGAGVDWSIAHFVVATRACRGLSGACPARGSGVTRRRLATRGRRAMVGGAAESVGRRLERTGIGGDPIQRRAKRQRFGTTAMRGQSTRAPVVLEP